MIDKSSTDLTVISRAAITPAHVLRYSGKLGRSVVAYLADEGWEVINADTRRPAGTSEGVWRKRYHRVGPIK